MVSGRRGKEKQACNSSDDAASDSSTASGSNSASDRVVYDRLILSRREILCFTAAFLRACGKYPESCCLHSMECVCTILL